MRTINKDFWKREFSGIFRWTGENFSLSKREFPVPLVQLLTLTPDFIAPALWPAKSHDLNLVDYKICDKLQERMYRSRIVTLTRYILNTD